MRGKSTPAMLKLMLGRLGRAAVKIILIVIINIVIAITNIVIIIINIFIIIMIMKRSKP